LSVEVGVRNALLFNYFIECLDCVFK